MSKTQREKSQGGLQGGLAFKDELAKQMAEIYQFQHWLNNQDEDEFDLVSFTIRAKRDEADDYLVVLRAWVDGEQKVGFHGGETIVEVLLGTCRRIKNRTMRWKEDQYAK